MAVKKRCLCAALCVCLLLAAAGSGCTLNKAEGVNIVATVFPAYDFVRELTRGIP